MNAQLGLNPFQTSKCWILSYCQRNKAQGRWKTALLLCSRDQAGHHKAAFCRQSVKGWKQHNSKADPHSHTQEQAPTADLSPPPTHSSELTLGRGSCGRARIASRNQSFPSQAAQDTPYLQSWYGWKNFFHALTDHSVSTSLLHSSSIYCWKVPGNLYSKLGFLAVLFHSGGAQSLTGFGVWGMGRAVTEGKQPWPFNGSLLQSPSIRPHVQPPLHSFYQTVTQQERASKQKHLLEIFMQQLITQLFLFLLQLTGF